MRADIGDGAAAGRGREAAAVTLDRIVLVVELAGLLLGEFVRRREAGRKRKGGRGEP